MQVFKTFMKVAKKRLHVSMIYIVIFVIIGIMMTNSASGSSDFTQTKLDISITDLDNTQASRALADYIGKNNKIVSIKNDMDSITDAIFYRQVDIVLTVNKGYSQKLADGETDGLFSNYRVPGSYSAAFFDEQLNQYISMITAYTTGGMTVDEAVQKSEQLAQSEIRVETLNFSENADVDYGEGITFYYQYLAYILIAVMITGLCPTLLVMMKKEIRNRTNCSCISSTSQMVQIVLGTIVFAIGVYLILTVAALFLYHSQLYNLKGLLAMLNGFVYLIFATMLTLFISVMSPGSKAVDMIGNVVSLGMSFLCGVFVPQSMLSGAVLNIGKFLPAYWYVKANNILAGTGGEVFNVTKFMTCVGIELAFSAAIFCVTLLVSRAKRSSNSI